MSSPFFLALLVACMADRASSYCNLERCGLEHNATNSYLVAVNTTVNFTGCKCNNTQPDFEGPVLSTCLANSTWSQSLPSCLPKNTCDRPSANINISCWNKEHKSWSHCERADLCVDERISWMSSDSDNLTVVVCQCDGSWSEEVHTPLEPGCDLTYLRRCGSDIVKLTNAGSYDGVVPPNTVATIRSSCDESLVTSVCDKSGFWLITNASITCPLPQAGVTAVGCTTSMGALMICPGGIKTEFCGGERQGERVAWLCSGSSRVVRTTCNCDGYWRDDVCPEPACTMADLSQCGGQITLSSSPNYYGVVSNGTTAVFNSSENICGPSVAVTAVCQSENEQWQTEDIVTCSLPDIGRLDVLFCRDEMNATWMRCENLRRKTFCSGEIIGSYCNTTKQNIVTCKCDGTWNRNICMADPATTPAAVPTSTTGNISPIPSHPSSHAFIQSSSPSLVEEEPANVRALAVPISVGVGLILLFVTALFLLVCNCLWCHYNRRKKKNYMSAPVVEYDTKGEKQELELMSENEVLPQEGCRNRTFSELNSYSCLHTDGEPTLVLMDEGFPVVQHSLQKDSVQERKLTFSQHYEVDMEMRKEDLDALRSGDYDSPYEEPPPTEQGVISLLKKYGAPSISENALTLLDQLGMGEFGEVYKGKLEKSKDLVLEVAVKTVKQGPKEEKGRQALLQEAALMAQFKHPNIITMYGLCAGEKLMVVTELMQQGDLRSHLLSIRKISQPDSLENLSQLLLSFCRHIAAGMSYLSSKLFIHRDLAARNILVSDGHICKIADFGLSRVMDEEYNVYLSSGGMVAVKWAAPESLSSFQYSSASDVWSFAVTMFEIWSLGYKPYHELTNTQAMKKVKDGYRLPPPPGCPRFLYELMIECWHPNPDRRPEFNVIVTQLNQPDYVLLKLPQDGKKDALSLKAPLRVSHDLYADLQNKYSSK